jgi:phosphate starvation-inducible PhoH-like protein
MNFTTFDAKDIVRHPIVQKIVEAYEAFDNLTRPKDKL